jgi:hypothetical protein
VRTVRQKRSPCQKRSNDWSREQELHMRDANTRDSGLGFRDKPDSGLVTQRNEEELVFAGGQIRFPTVTIRDNFRLSDCI